MPQAEFVITFGPREVARWGWEALLAGEIKTAAACFYVSIKWWVKP